jgi:hypothetical protein
VRIRNLSIATAVIVILAIVIVVGLQPRDGSVAIASPSPTATPTASPSPAATATPATPSPSATPSGPIYNDDFGFIVAPGDVLVARIRKESSDTTIGELRAQNAAVSPDGRQIAYWTLAVGAAELRILTAGTGAELTVLTLSADQRGGGIVWSSDGAALLYSTESGGFGVSGGANRATLGIHELAASGIHGRTIDTQTATGLLYQPIGWDRSTNLAAAALTGEGGVMITYVTVRIDPNNQTNASRDNAASRNLAMGSIRASTDAKLVMGITIASDIFWWPIDRFGANRMLTVQAGAGRRGALWRPGTHQIGFIMSDGHSTFDPFFLGEVDAAVPNWCCPHLGGLPPTARLETFRADGSAVLFVVVPAPAGLGATYDYTLVRISDGARSTHEFPTSGERVPFKVMGRIVPFGSVRLR